MKLKCCGYMSPEYAMEGLFSEKSDVFSFGVLLLEILSGRKNTSFYNHEQAFSLLGYVSLSKFINYDHVFSVVIISKSDVVTEVAGRCNPTR
jgi:hypothetical protein